MNLKHNQPGQDGHPDPKEVPKTQHTEDTQLSGEMGNRHFRDHISQGGHEGTQESGSSLFQISAALKHTAGAMWNPHQASETQVGWEAALPVAQSHIWEREESWGQQQGRNCCCYC